MAVFNPETKFLVLSDKPLEKIRDTYEDSDQYISYKKYINETLPKDVKEIFIPLLNTIISKNRNIILDPSKSVVKVDENKNYANRRFYDVKVRLYERSVFRSKTGADGKIEPYLEDVLHDAFVLFELPYMDRSGILYNRGSQNTIISSFSLDDALTYDGDKFKFVDSDNSFVMLNPSNPKIEMFKTKISAVSFISALYQNMYGKERGMDLAKRFVLGLRDSNVIVSLVPTEDYFKRYGKDAFEKAITSKTGAIPEEDAKAFDLDKKYKAGRFNTSTSTRAILNEILSLKNAIGRVLSRDVFDRQGKVIAPEGTLITENTINIFDRNFISTIFVEADLNVSGNLLGSSYFIENKIVIGTPVIPEMCAKYPHLQGYINVPDTIDMGSDFIIIPEGRIITRELCNYFKYVGYKEILYKTSKTSKKLIPAFLEEEFISNRHFPTYCVNSNILDNTYDSNTVFVDEDYNVHPDATDITCHDAAAMLSLFSKVSKGELLDVVVDPDAGLRKKVNQCNEHFHKAFIHAVNVIERTSKDAIGKKITSSSSLDNSSALNTLFSKFTKNFWTYLYKDMKVISFLGTTNPVDTLSSLTKINTITANKNAVPDRARRMTMGHYGRVCPYEIPQSGKLGAVNNAAIHCRIVDGTLYTPYYKVIVDDSTGKVFVSNEIVELSVAEEEKYKIADINELTIDYSTREILTKEKVLARVPTRNSLEKISIAMIDVRYVDLISISVDQHCSHAATTVPYAGCDDTARISFGMSMVKQSKGLVKAEIPTVCTTGFLNIPNMNTFYKIFAERDGVVKGVSPDCIDILYDGDSKLTTYRFSPTTFSDQTMTVRVTRVEENERVKRGHVLMSSNYIVDGILATGVNALVAYKTNGFNYEDGVTISERLSQKLTSYGSHKDEFSISKDTRFCEAVDIDYSSYLSKEDRFFTKEDHGGGVDDITSKEMYTNHCTGFVASKEFKVDTNNINKRTHIIMRSVSFDKVHHSDKICNRHGNKTVDCKIYPNSEMMYLENGEFVDLYYNPAGIVSRMNIGQQCEAAIGLAATVLGIRILCDAFNSPPISQIKRLVGYACELANNPNIEEVFAKYTEYPSELHEHCRENIRKIRRWRGTFDEDCKAYLIDPKTGKRSIEPVIIGINYIYKLVQEGESKLHSRGGQFSSNYVQKTQSPPEGASKNGGQGVGYMELDALLAYGCSSFIREIFNGRSDNPVARNNLTVKALHSGDSTYMLDEKYGMRRSVEHMLETFKSLGIHVSATEDEINLREPEKRQAYKKKVLLSAKLEIDEDEDSHESIFDNHERDFRKFKRK